MPFVTMVPSSRTSVIARSSGGKVDIKRQGLNSVKNDVVRKNLQGVSESMKKKEWVDSSGRKGTLRSFVLQETSHMLFIVQLPYPSVVSAHVG